MSNLRPTLTIASVSELQTETLLFNSPELSAFTFDLDKTLLGQHGTEVPEEHLEALGRISAEGFRLGLISNASSEHRTQRVLEIAGSMSQAINHDIVVVTSRMVGGKKKPLRPVFDRMAKVLDLPNDRIAYVGDQLLKDIVGANRANYGASVLVAPFGSGDDPRVRFLQRPLEAAMRPFIGLPFRTKNFG